MFCPKCGKEAPSGSRFCDSCGAAMPGDQPQTNNVPPSGYAPQPGYAPAPGYPTQPVYALPLKNAGIAAVLAFLWAGLGHIYLGKIGAGILYMILYVVLWVVGIFVAVFTLGIGLIIPIIFWIWQLYDAYKMANQYNAALQQTGRAPW